MFTKVAIEEIILFKVARKQILPHLDVENSHGHKIFYLFRSDKSTNTVFFFEIFYLCLRFGYCLQQNTSRGVPPGGGIGGLDLTFAEAWKGYQFFAFWLLSRRTRCLGK